MHTLSAERWSINAASFELLKIAAKKNIDGTWDGLASNVTVHYERAGMWGERSQRSAKVLLGIGNPGGNKDHSFAIEGLDIYASSLIDMPEYVDEEIDSNIRALMNHSHSPNLENLEQRIAAFDESIRCLEKRAEIEEILAELIALSHENLQAKDILDQLYDGAKALTKPDVWSQRVVQMIDSSR